MLRMVYHKSSGLEPLNISYQISQLVCLLAVTVIARSFYIHNHEHRWIVIAALPVLLIAWFILSAAYQAGLLFIDIADALIDIGRRK